MHDVDRFLTKKKLSKILWGVSMLRGFVIFSCDIKRSSLEYKIYKLCISNNYI